MSIKQPFSLKNAIMLIQVHGNGFSLTSELRENVQMRIESSFSRFHNRIGRVKAYLSDLNGPKKGIGKSIRFVIDVVRGPAVVIEERGENWSAMLVNASDRASQTLTRKLKRSRSRKDRMSMAGDTV